MVGVTVVWIRDSWSIHETSGRNAASLMLRHVNLIRRQATVISVPGLRTDLFCQRPCVKNMITSCEQSGAKLRESERNGGKWCDGINTG